LHKHCHNDTDLFNRDGKHYYTGPSKIRYMSIKNVLKEINIVINYVGFIFNKSSSNRIQIYTVRRFHQGILYLKIFIKFVGTSLNVPDVIYCHKKSNAFPSPIFVRLTNERQHCVQISYIEVCPYRIINVERMSKALFMPLAEVCL
jgi:hypothetical protein